jgi:hypothetical protein
MGVSLSRLPPGEFRINPSSKLAMEGIAGPSQASSLDPSFPPFFEPERSYAGTQAYQKLLSSLA